MVNDYPFLTMIKDDTTPHIGISFPGEFPDELIDKITNELNEEGLHIKTQKREAGPIIYASTDFWGLMPLVGIFIASSYFNGFLGEMGKDHYVILKNRLKKIIASFRSIEITNITASTAPNKITNEDTQSRVVSLYIQTKSQKTIKVLFDNELTSNDWDNAIDVIFQYVIQNYEEYPNDHLSKQIEPLDLGEGKVIYAVMTKEGHIAFYNDKTRRETDGK